MVTTVVRHVRRRANDCVECFLVRFDTMSFFLEFSLECMKLVEVRCDRCRFAQHSKSIRMLDDVT